MAKMAYETAMPQIQKAFEKTIEQNQKHIVQPPTPEKCSELGNQLFFTTLASMPGRISHAQAEAGVWWENIKKVSQLPVKDVAVGVAFGVEVLCWFSIGEIIGRGFTLSGYYP